MGKKKSAMLPKFEVLIVLVFFLSFLIWAASKCSATKAQFKKEAAAEQGEVAKTDSSLTRPIFPTGISADTLTRNRVSRTIKERYTPLYVTIPGLNLRTEPDLNSKILLKFNLYEEVIFLNEVTDSTLEVSLGKERANEPWIKVKSKKGHVGWVYGAGVHYYKKKRQGVE